MDITNLRMAGQYRLIGVMICVAAISFSAGLLMNSRYPLIGVTQNHNDGPSVPMQQLQQQQQQHKSPPSSPAPACPSSSGAPSLAPCTCPAQSSPAPACPSSSGAPSSAPSSSANRDAPTAGSPCTLSLVSYEPSAFEAEWRYNVSTKIGPDDKVCALMLADKPRWMPRLQAWITIGVDLNRQRAGPGQAALVAAQGARMDAVSHVLSRMVYKDSCTGKNVTNYVSPLAGILRDPRPICSYYDPEWNMLTPTTDYSQVKDYIIIDPRYLEGVRARLAPPAPGVRSPHRAFLFDAGATTWNDAGMSSVRELVERFADHGIEFDQVREHACVSTVMMWAGRCAMNGWVRACV